MKIRSAVQWARVGRQVGRGLAALVGAAVAGAVVGSAAQTTRSEATILQYDEQGRVIDKVLVLPYDEAGATSGAAGAGQTGPGQSNPNGAAAVAGRASFVTGEILAVSEDPAFTARARSLGFPTLERSALAALDMTVYRLRTPARTPVPQALATFRQAFPDVTSDANGMVYPAAGTSGWDAVGTVGWPTQRAACGRGAKIGMIDTPLDLAHRAFANRQVQQESFLPRGRTVAPPGHGTAVAALLVGDPASDGFGGLVPEAQLYAGNIFEELETGQVVGNLHALLKAFDWIIEQEVDVLNLSLETGSNVILDRAVERTLRKGLIVVAAAGNGGADARPAFPAAHPRVLAATAIDPDLQAYRHANHGDYIDFAAPGVQLWTAVPGGGEFQSGTSFAVPFLTAAVAMQLAAGERPDPMELRGGAEPLGARLGSARQGRCVWLGAAGLSPGLYLRAARASLKTVTGHEGSSAIVS